MPRKLSPEEADEAKKSAQDLFDQLDLDKSGYIEASDLEKIYTKWCADVGVVSTPEDDAELKELIAVSNISSFSSLSSSSSRHHHYNQAKLTILGVSHILKGSHLNTMARDAIQTPL